MELVTSIVDGIFSLLQAIVFGVVVIACFAIVMKYKSKKPSDTIQVEVVAQKPDEEVNLRTGEITKKKSKPYNDVIFD